METLRVTTVQCSLNWEERSKNLEKFDSLLSGLAGNTDLVLLPETFTTGFSMNSPHLAEKMDGVTVAWLKDKAIALGGMIAGSLIIEDGGKYFNRMILADKNGAIRHYDKRHLFGMGDEDRHFSAGQERLVFELNSWKVCPMICYDLRFPVWSRNTEGFDLLFYIANWPAKRSYAWRSLLLARAIENQCYVIGVNRVGDDGNGYPHSGDTVVIPPMGDTPIYERRDLEEVVTHELHRHELQKVRTTLPFLNDRDTFEIIKG